MPQNISSRWLRALPKAELHLHLEGAVSPETLVELSQRHDREALTLPEARRLYQYGDFTGFLMAFKTISERLRSPQDFELIAYRALERLAMQGVAHAEIYVSAGVIHYWNRMPFESLFEGMERGRLRALHAFGISASWIFDAVRHFGTEAAAKVFRQAAQLKRHADSVVGIGLGGDERRAGADAFRDLYLEARDAGLHLTVHAGETEGPESIWAALNIGAERIGHALSAHRDPELMDVLAQRQIPVEICISSNLRTGCCAALDEHPVRRYFEAGLMVTLNSDDPALFESDLQCEFRLANEKFGFTREDLRELASNSIEASFLPAERKLLLLNQMSHLE